MSAVEFSVHFTIEDRDPVLLVNEGDWGYAYKGVPFESSSYVAANPRWGSDRDVKHWLWSRRGLLLKKDGTPRADRAKGKVSVREADVPDYAKLALYKEVERRAADAKIRIDEWVTAALGVVAHNVNVVPGTETEEEA